MFHVNLKMGKMTKASAHSQNNKCEVCFENRV